MKLIKDLFKYFKEPWCFAIYNDKFPVLEKNLNNHITNLTVFYIYIYINRICLIFN